jgi:hypothetical protein
MVASAFGNPFQGDHVRQAVGELNYRSCNRIWTTDRIDPDINDLKSPSSPSAVTAQT